MRPEGFEPPSAGIFLLYEQHHTHPFIIKALKLFSTTDILLFGAHQVTFLPHSLNN